MNLDDREAEFLCPLQVRFERVGWPGYAIGRAATCGMVDKYDVARKQARARAVGGAATESEGDSLAAIAWKKMRSEQSVLIGCKGQRDRRAHRENSRVNQFSIM
jgi:hypothetical protein